MWELNENNKSANVNCNILRKPRPYSIVSDDRMLCQDEKLAMTYPEQEENIK